MRTVVIPSRGVHSSKAGILILYLTCDIDQEISNEQPYFDEDNMFIRRCFFDILGILRIP